MRKLIVLAALTTLVVAGPALAAKIKSGTSTVTLSEGASTALTTHGIVVTPIAPATAGDGTFTLPIARGHINKKNRGYLLHKGGLKLTKGEKSISFRRPLVVVGKKGGVLAVQSGRRCHRGQVRGHGGRHGHRAVVCRVTFRAVARLSDLSRDGTTATATLKLTKYAARQLNKLAGTDFAKAGDLLGTGKVVVTDSATPVASPPPVVAG